MGSRRSGDHDAVDARVGCDFFDRHGGPVDGARDISGAGTVGVRHRLQDTQLVQDSDMVATPSAAADNDDGRRLLHHVHLPEFVTATPPAYPLRLVRARPLMPFGAHTGQITPGGYEGRVRPGVLAAGPPVSFRPSPHVDEITADDTGAPGAGLQAAPDPVPPRRSGM